jgi:hypothetical protein
VTFWVREVLQLFRAGISEDAILATLRTVQIEARPTMAEVLELRALGTSDEFVAWFLSAALQPPFEDPPRRGDDVRPSIRPGTLGR